MDDTVEIVDDSRPVLLPEILSHIFAYLGVTDRKRVRLTCRSWYDCSVHPCVIKSEKYIFQLNASVEDVATLMLRSHYSLLNLEFQGLIVKELDPDVWKVCGDRIQTLEFFECQWTPETIINVVLYCTNLTSIVIESKLPYLKATCPIKILCLTNVLDYLIKKGLRRPKLRTLSIFNDGVLHLPESVLNKLFLLFPGIKHFGTGMVNFFSAFINHHISCLAKPAVSLRLDQCFNPETRLESLTLNVLPMNGNWMETFVRKAEQGIGLKKLETIIIYRRSMKDNVFDFFKSQRNLQDLKLGIAGANADEKKELYFHILANCPNLQKFFFENDVNRMRLEPSELPRFFSSTSKLKYLGIFFDVYHGTPAPLYDDLLAKSAQWNLTSLRWHNGNVDLSNALLQRCSSLMHLYLGGECRNSTLQIIFQFLVELRTLAVYSIHPSCTDYGITGRGVDGRQEGYSIKRLQQLKYLRVQDAGSGLTGKSTLELQLPRLELLSLKGKRFTEELCSEEALDRFASHLPELRGVDIGQFQSEWMIMRVCSQLKNLYCLISVTEKRPDPHSELPFVKNIFGSCPSLKHIFLRGESLSIRTLFTGNVFHSDSRRFKFPDNIFRGQL